MEQKRDKQVCITCHSVPAYSDQMGNKGAFITMGSDLKPNFTTYEAVVRNGRE